MESDAARPDEVRPFEASTADGVRFSEISEQLIDAVRDVLAPWVHHCVAPYREAQALAETTGGPQVQSQIDSAAERCSTEITTAIADLVRTDIDQQQTTPLAILRGAGRYPTTLLKGWGVRPVDRDPFDIRADPDDIYSLAPKSWADLGPEVGEAGLMWGAAKAHIHLARRRQSNP